MFSFARPSQAAYPYIAKIYQEAVPTIVCLFLMTVACTWLLLHAASQWARTRTEVRMVQLHTSMHGDTCRIVPEKSGCDCVMKMEWSTRVHAVVRGALMARLGVAPTVPHMYRYICTFRQCTLTHGHTEPTSHITDMITHD